MDCHPLSSAEYLKSQGQTITGISDNFFSNIIVTTNPKQTYIHTAIYVLKIHFYYLQKFNLETGSEKPEVDIMTPLLVAEAQVIQ